MEKPAATDHDVHDLVRRRWSPRAFSERLVPDDTLASLFEAARWAPSCFNEQPWRYVVATKEDPTAYDRMMSCLVKGNARWAKRAPVLCLSVARQTFERNGEENRHAFHDVGLASENLVLQALDLGLFVHQMAGFHADKARETFSIPEEFEPVAMMAIGYPGDPSRLPDDLRDREEEPRTRRPLSRTVFAGSWGTPSPVVNG